MERKQAEEALAASERNASLNINAMPTLLDSKVNLDAPRVDGGMVDDDLLMEFQADILNRNVVRPVIKETTALGSAYAAGLAVGFYKRLEELGANWGVGHTWKPQMESFMRERLYQEWKKAVAVVRLGGMSR